MATATGEVPTPIVTIAPNLIVTTTHNYGTRFRSGSLPSRSVNSDDEVSFKSPQSLTPQSEKKKRRNDKNKQNKNNQSTNSPNNSTLQHSTPNSDSRQNTSTRSRQNRSRHSVHFSKSNTVANANSKVISKTSVSAVVSTHAVSTVCNAVITQSTVSSTLNSTIVTCNNIHAITSTVLNTVSNQNITNVTLTRTTAIISTPTITSQQANNTCNGHVDNIIQNVSTQIDYSVESLSSESEDEYSSECIFEIHNNTVSEANAVISNSSQIGCELKDQLLRDRFTYLN